MNFPDLNHFLQLRKDLWREPTSKVCLMVGAGFSLNSKPVSPGINQNFSTWRQMVWKMFDEVYPPSPAESLEAREKRFDQSDTLTIASIYKATFGEQKLNRLIKESNPDEKRLPGPLHSSILNLPWRDIYTTNYDRLLENVRATKRVYQTVTKVGDLASTFAPRIVKLHGSFPSQTPFIITEEDFRTYPKKFAPFVNTVQQSLLENSFLLVGFSGSDPNFLKWIGWIRDEIGVHQSPIYLLLTGERSPKEGERNLLRERNVTPIDLASVFLGTPLEKDHGRQLEWFLASLLAAKPSPSILWPRQVTQEPSGDFPVAPIPLSLQLNADTSEGFQIENLPTVERYAAERRAFPGWIILPRQERASLYHDLVCQAKNLLEEVADLTLHKKLEAYYELNWKYETAMAPIFDDLKEPFELVVYASLSDPNMEKVDWTKWQYLTLALLREARETFDSTRWEEFHGLLIDERDTLGPDFDENRFCYEEILWKLWNLDSEGAKEIISNWDPSELSLAYSIRKVAVLTEVQKINEAAKLLEKTFENIRAAQRSEPFSVRLKSLESCCLYSMIQFIGHKQLAQEEILLSRDYCFQRLRELRADGFDIFGEISYLKVRLERDNPLVVAGRHRKPTFDIGLSSETHTSVNDHLEPYLPAFQYIRMIEIAGWPLKLPGINTAGNISNAASWVSPLIRDFGPAIVVRISDYTTLKKLSCLSRYGIATYPSEEAVGLYKWGTGALSDLVNRVDAQGQFDDRERDLLAGLAELISRFGLHADSSERVQEYTLFLKFICILDLRDHYSISEIPGKWAERIFRRMDKSELPETFSKILNLETKLISKHFQTSASNWSKSASPIENFPYWRLSKKQIRKLRIASKDTISKLINSVQEIEGVASRYLVGILRALEQYDLLFARDKATITPLIDSGGNQKWALECLESGTSIEEVISNTQKPWFKESNNQWSSADLAEISAWVEDWWKQNNTVFGAQIFWDNNCTKELARRAFIQILFHPTSSPKKALLKETKKLIKEPSGHFLFVIPSYLIHVPEDHDAFLKLLERALESDDKALVISASRAVRVWANLSQTSSPLLSWEPRLLTLLQCRVSFRRSGGLDFCIQVITELMGEVPRLFTPSNIENLLSSLPSWWSSTEIYSESLTSENSMAPEDRPNFRWRISGLVGGLDRLVEYLSTPCGETFRITEWETKAKEDLLPEVSQGIEAGRISWDMNHAYMLKKRG